MDVIHSCKYKRHCLSSTVFSGNDNAVHKETKKAESLDYEPSLANKKGLKRIKLQFNSLQFNFSE